MAMRRAEAHQTLGPPGPLHHPALSACDLAGRLPSQFVDLLTHPRFRLGQRSGSCRRRIPEVLVGRDHGPQAARHLVGEGDGHQHARLLGQHSAQPAAVRRSLAACMLHDGHRSGDEQSTDVALAHLRCCSESLLATF